MDRSLKVSTLLRAAGDFHYSRCAVVPQLRIAGLWLRDAGFSVGSRVRVQVQKGQLIITTGEEVAS